LPDAGFSVLLHGFEVGSWKVSRSGRLQLIDESDGSVVFELSYPTAVIFPFERTNGTHSHPSS
jgi:hypothetical protein